MPSARQGGRARPALLRHLCDDPALGGDITAVAPGAHAVLIMDQAGWHTTKRFVPPSNISIISLPARCPGLNPVENIWQYVRDNWLSNRIFTSYDDIATQYVRRGTSSSSNP